MKRFVFAAGVVLVGVACSTEPSGTLEIVLDTSVPTVTNLTTLNLTGTVNRTPPIKTVYIVTVTRGTFSAADTVDSAGHFAIKASLAPDADNAVVIGATDAQGSVAPQVTLTITHDDVPPGIATATPAIGTDQVALSSTVSFTLTEPAIQKDLGVFLVHQGTVVPGNLLWNSDSTQGTFAPSSPLSPNTIYTLYFLDIKDKAGNVHSVLAGTCFVTAAGTATIVVSDALGDYAQAGPTSPSIIPADLVEVRYGRDGTALTGVFKFTDNRTFDTLAHGGMIETYLDTDHDTTTGAVFRGMGADYIVLLEPQPGRADSAAVFQILSVSGSSLSGNYTYTFYPDYCGKFTAFSVPFSSIGNGDGVMKVVSFSLAGGGAVTGNSNFLIDAVPNTGFTALSLPAAAPSLPFAGEPAITAATESRAARTLRSIRNRQ